MIKKLTILLLTLLVLSSCSSELDRCIEANLPQLTNEEVIEATYGEELQKVWAENEKKVAVLNRWDKLNNPINRTITPEEFKKDPLVFDRYEEEYSEKREMLSEWYEKELAIQRKIFTTEEYKQKVIQEYIDGREDVARNTCNSQGIY